MSSKSEHALGREGAKHTVRAMASTAELVLATSRSLDPGRAPELALIDLARAQEVAARVSAELAAAAEHGREALAALDEAALGGAAPPLEGAEAA